MASRSASYPAQAPPRPLCPPDRQEYAWGGGLPECGVAGAASLTLLLSPTQRQSGELFRKVQNLHRLLGKPVPCVRETVLSLELANGSRIIALPGDEATVRCFSGVSLVIIDEAARARDELHAAVRPMLATSGGMLVGLSTPFGKRGWFHDAWAGEGNWQRVQINAEQCPRIPKEFLAEERAAMGPRWFAQEYECEFVNTVDAVFTHEQVLGACPETSNPCSGV